jgi:DNA replication and repair protein RecF
MITSLKLTNFRQFKTLSLDFNNDFVIIAGDNTKGKSTILESIYLVTNGQTPWGEFEDEFNTEQDNDRYFRIEVKDRENISYTYFRDNQKRLLKIDNRNTIPKKFFEKVCSVIFSPERIDLLMISGSKRREFIDQILVQTDIEYADTLSKYNKTLKQRNAYLKKLSKRFYESGLIDTNDSQLLYWTKQISLFGSQIISKRSEIIEKLNSEDIKLEYKPEINLNLFEELSDTENIQRILYEQLVNSLRRDVATGITNIGPHRDDWNIYQGKDVKRFGSRGEKRVAIGRLIFQSLELISESKGYRPLLLLDDISSELDNGNTYKALSNKTLNKQQTILTVIDINHIPEEFKNRAQIIDLNLT